ncbi:MAG TPA: hypothetical protein VIC87_07035 [Vicinamibacteria bacterium]|jgi:hypothetical protein
MALNREERMRLKMEELEALRDEMSAMNGKRLGSLKSKPPVEEVEEEVAEEVPSGLYCDACDTAVEVEGARYCPHCGSEVGGEGGDSEDDAE